MIDRLHAELPLCRTVDKHDIVGLERVVVTAARVLFGRFIVGAFQLDHVLKNMLSPTILYHHLGRYHTNDHAKDDNRTQKKKHDHGEPLHGEPLPAGGYREISPHRRKLGLWHSRGDSVGHCREGRHDGWVALAVDDGGYFLLQQGEARHGRPARGNGLGEV